MASVSVRFPFDRNLSKNRRFRTTKTGRGYVPKEVKDLHDGLVYLFVSETVGTFDPKRKVSIHIHVQMPDHRGDAINVLDTIADVVKQAIGVDDRWFEISGLTWDIQKDDPQVTVNVVQLRGNEDHG